MTWTWLDEVIPDAVVVADDQQLITFFNVAAEQLWGYRAAEVLGRPLSTLLPERFAAGHAGHMRGFDTRAETTRRMDRRSDVFARRRDGTEVPCEVSIARRGDQFVAIVRDLSEQKRARRIGRLGSWEIDVAEDRLWWSDEARQILGVGDRPRGARWADFLERVHPEDRSRFEAAARATFEERAPWDIEHRVVRPDGAVRDVHQVGDPSRDEQGRVLRLVATMHDVTEARSTERGLAQSEATLRSLFATSREAIMLLDDALTVRSFNEAAGELARVGQERLVAGEALSPRARTHLQELLTKALGGEYAQLERKIPSSPPRLLELSGSPVRLAGGGIAGLTLVCRDVTERRNAEEQLRQAQKMETVGQLAGGIAHDFNNLLTVVIAAASALRHDLGPDHPSLGELADIEGASARAAALTRQLLSFARLQPTVPRVVEVSGMIAALERVLRRVIGSHLILEVKLEPGCFVRIDPTQLDQVLMNLAVNARDAMPGGGTLTVSTERRVDEGQVWVRVCDTGAGIDPATRARLFEPFFTTKPPGQGTGLGLATCYGIVKQAGGQIEVTSELGQGACFELRFPLTAAPELRSRPSPTPTVRREVVLVAEDEPRVRAVVVRALEGAGYTVLAAGSGVEALKLLEPERGAISLLLTDVVMPSMGGPALAAAVRERWPRVPVIFMTGYPDDARLSLQDGSVELVSKPFDGPELLSRVRRLLDEQPAQLS
ncbi:MAG: PAS domain S-box protein [Archangium sp.]|nr:PAS domain S-box protein [Archangium sp.]